MMKPFGSLLFAVSFAVLITCIYSQGVNAEPCSAFTPCIFPMQCCVAIRENVGYCRNLSAKGTPCEMEKNSSIYKNFCYCANGAKCKETNTGRICQ
uniref:U2-Liphistoxin-Lsp1a_1 n=1 Tax=Liphistius sp. SGP-2016 TaxID=1905180 RepID=A0A4Q8K2P5_9ARAC